MECSFILFAALGAQDGNQAIIGQRGTGIESAIDLQGRRAADTLLLEPFGGLLVDQ